MKLKQKIKTQGKRNNGDTELPKTKDTMATGNLHASIITFNLKGQQWLVWSVD